MRILMITPYAPWPLYGGSSVRMFNFIKCFKEIGHEIFVLAGSGGSPGDLAALNDICKEVHFYQLPSKNKLLQSLRFLFSSKPYPYSNFVSPSLNLEVERLLGENDFDLIWVNFSIMLDSLPNGLNRTKAVVMDQHECEELVYKDYLASGKPLERVVSIINLIRLKGFKKRVLKKVNAVISVSKQEADFTKRQLESGVHSFIAPNGVSGDFLNNDPRQDNSKNDIVFCGNMGIRRNVEAVDWFVKEIFPMVCENVPDAMFWIVGSDPKPEVFKLESVKGVKVTGKVKNISEYYRKGKVFVAPYHFGAGTKLKILEAMASGVPIVTTQAGCQGIEVKNGNHVLVADDAKLFSEHILKVLSDRQLAENLVKNSLELVNKNYRWANIVLALESELKSIIKK